MANGKEEAAIHKVEAALRRVLIELGPQKKSESGGYETDYFVIALFAALFTAAFSIVGVFEMIIPLFLLILSLLAWCAEVVILTKRFAWSARTIAPLWLFTAVCFAGFFYVAWDVFVVDINVRFGTGSQVNSDDEQYRFAVELSNRGKATSLRNWGATLVKSDGTEIEGLPLSLLGASTEIETEDRSKTQYALPECDLLIETSRAVQSGDSVYGIIAFQFPGAAPLINDRTIVLKLRATDMLGRTIKSAPISFDAIHKHARTVFPCPTKNSPSDK